MDKTLFISCLNYDQCPLFHWEGGDIQMQQNYITVVKVDGHFLLSSFTFITMSLKIPEEIKYITPYVQRGQEVVARDPVVSYYGKIIIQHALIY